MRTSPRLGEILDADLQAFQISLWVFVLSLKLSTRFGGWLHLY